MNVYDAKFYLAIIYLSNEEAEYLDFAYSRLGEELHEFVVRIIKEFQPDNIDFYRSGDMYKICEV